MPEPALWAYLFQPLVPPAHAEAAQTRQLDAHAVQTLIAFKTGTPSVSNHDTAFQCWGLPPGASNAGKQPLRGAAERAAGKRGKDRSAVAVVTGR
jgi:hypothetical protein